MKSIVLLLFLLSCLSCQNDGGQTKKVPSEVTFGDVVNLEDVELILVSNHKGNHELAESQRTELLSKLKNMVYQRGASYKMGGVSITLIVKGKDHQLTGRTHGDKIEVHRSIINQNETFVGAEEWLYFYTNELNMDNY